MIKFETVWMNIQTQILQLFYCNEALRVYVKKNYVKNVKNIGRTFEKGWTKKGTVITRIN